MCLNEACASLHPGGGGGGYSECILVGCALTHQNRGILGAGTAPQKNKGGGEVLGAGATRKGGGLRCGHNQTNRGRMCGDNPKSYNLELAL